jgi:hypothetical protein
MFYLGRFKTAKCAAAGKQWQEGKLVCKGLPSVASRRVYGMNAFLDLSAALALHDGNVVLALQLEPELRCVAEVERQPKSGIRRN